MKSLLTILRTSEFWAFLASATTEALQAPVPDDVKVVGWAYIVLRVLGKLAKFTFPHPDGGKWLAPD